MLIFIAINIKANLYNLPLGVSKTRQNRDCLKIIKKPSSPEDVPYTSANLSNTKKLINWHPKTKIDQGLDKTFNWHVENKEWLKKIKTY